MESETTEVSEKWPATWLQIGSILFESFTSIQVRNLVISSFLLLTVCLWLALCKLIHIIFLHFFCRHRITNAAFNSSLSWRMLTHISMSCSSVGIIDPEQLLEWVLSFFIASASPLLWQWLPVVVINQLAVVQQNSAKDTSQMKFSPSQETLSPFVFIILTSLFKELSSPTSPARLLCLSHPSHHHHLFGAHPGWGAAMCFSHSSLPQKMCRRVGGDEERHLLTKINRHLPSLLYIYLQWVRRGSDSDQLCFGGLFTPDFTTRSPWS